MVFEVGKYYRHSTGSELAVICEIETTIRGKGLLAETTDHYCELCVVGTSEENTIGFTEISKEEWMKNFS